MPGKGNTEEKPINERYHRELSKKNISFNLVLLAIAFRSSHFILRTYLASMSITVKNLTRLYGEQRAVDGISFSVTPGEIVGFLGPNGAGKSTTMKMITGYL